ncbi:hypothetical protein Athai_28590 [Actinocatenispora thailandica]|uniref:DUF1023 domain-containing protein n=1 Tax=Actinocatenispora thailandica TaxID=227318 RepID=A0A7R7DPM0_9ACTN|nr:alpha/beta hydrolase [Actinocatenispora thailandica]BCJ35356.1 hypothetical protein Athai_28590 [Actinocatenispora thailandica]
MRTSTLLAPHRTPPRAQTNLVRAIAAAGRHPGQPSPAAPVDVSPQAVHDYLTGLTEPVRRRLTARFPAAVGTLDGAPPAMRYAANRRRMRPTRFGAWSGQYLLFDPAPPGRVALVYGDLRTADRVAVLVPGADTRLADFARGLGGRRHRAPAVQAVNLYRAADALRPNRVSVVAWLGYRTPRGPGIDVARQQLAAAGATALTRFVRGLTVVAPHAALMLLGHSYGSVVIGLAAARLPAQVRDVAVFGSPGVGVDTAAELFATARIWAACAPGDWTRFVPGVRRWGFGHGRRPTDPAFGARPFCTAGVTDHDHYLAAGTGSLAALAAILTA